MDRRVRQRSQGKLQRPAETCRPCSFSLFSLLLAALILLETGSSCMQEEMAVGLVACKKIWRLATVMMADELGRN